jgi:hypothetical protein
MIYRGIELKLAIFIAVKHLGESFVGVYPRAVFCTLARSVLAGIFSRMVLYYQH